MDKWKTNWRFIICISFICLGDGRELDISTNYSECGSYFILCGHWHILFEVEEQNKLISWILPLIRYIYNNIMHIQKTPCRGQLPIHNNNNYNVICQWIIVLLTDSISSDRVNCTCQAGLGLFLPLLLQVPLGHVKWLMCFFPAWGGLWQMRAIS